MPGLPHRPKPASSPSGTLAWGLEFIYHRELEFIHHRALEPDGFWVYCPQEIGVFLSEIRKTASMLWGGIAFKMNTRLDEIRSPQLDRR